MRGPGTGIALMQTAFPGDVILAAGLVRSIREAWPEVPIAMVVRPESSALARMMDPALEVIPWDKQGGSGAGQDTAAVTGRLREGPWGAALIPQRFFRTARLARAAGLAPRIGFDLAAGVSLLYTRTVPYRRGVHEVERNHDLLVALADDLGVEPPPLRLPRLTLTPAGIAEAEAIFALLGDRDTPPPFVALAPGSVWRTKRWPEAYWVSLAGTLADEGLGVLFIGGPQDRQRCDRIAGKARAGVAAAGALSWEGSAAVLNRAHLLVSNDSAPAHLAGAVRCPVVEVFGPTVPAFGFGPLGAGSLSVGLPLGCRPCRLHGGDACPEGHFRCMHDLHPEHVVTALTRTIQEVYGGGQTERPPFRISTGGMD